MIENVVASVCDDNPKLRPRKWMIVFIVCLVGFVLGIPLATGVSFPPSVYASQLKTGASMLQEQMFLYVFQAGYYIVELVMTYLARPMIFIGIMECVVVAYFYGKLYS